MHQNLLWFSSERGLPRPYALRFLVHHDFLGRRLCVLWRTAAVVIDGFRLHVLKHQALDIADELETGLALIHNRARGVEATAHDNVESDPDDESLTKSTESFEVDPQLSQLICALRDQNQRICTGSDFEAARP
jgi:hypothetical protein